MVAIIEIGPGGRPVVAVAVAVGGIRLMVVVVVVLCGERGRELGLGTCI